MLEAGNDYDAVQAWLASKRSGPQHGPVSATERSYRKEAERLILWAVLVRHKPLSSLSVEDAAAFRDFLGAPPASWCGPRYSPRWSTSWRPLEGALSTSALRQSMTVIKALYAFLMKQNYVVGSPFSGISLPRESARALGSNRTLTMTDIQRVIDHLQVMTTEFPESQAKQRLAKAVLWLYATGLRVHEISQVRCGALTHMEYCVEDATMASGWLLEVVGKGNKIREVPVPIALLNALADELRQHGLPASPADPANSEVPILARFVKNDVPQIWSTSALQEALKKLFVAVAAKSAPADATRLLGASAHWLRHSHASHALQGRPGRAPVPIQVVQNNLGHASIGTTSGYLTTERDARLRAMQGFWGENQLKSTQ